MTVSKPPDMGNPEPATVREWTDLVRRARLGRTIKGIAFLLATYADADGTRVFPGVARVALAAEVDYKTAKRAIADLVAYGLLEKVRSRSGVKGRSDEYRLVFDSERTHWAAIMPPDQFNDAVEKIRAEQRRSSRPQRTVTAVPRPKPKGQGSAAPVPEPESEPEPEIGTGNGVPDFDEGRGTARPQDGERRSAVPNHRDLVTTTTNHKNAGDLRTDLTVVERAPPKIGNGFCLVCYAAGQITLAVDEIAGSACKAHQTVGAAA